MEPRCEVHGSYVDESLESGIGIKSQGFWVESFNLFNYSNFAAPDGNISNATFGVITSTYPPRQL